MAQFPLSHSSTRAPRVRLPRNESVCFVMDGKRMPAVLEKLSVTGGLACLPEAVDRGSIAEFRLSTKSGSLSGIVEMLPATSRGNEKLQPFRFLAMEDADHERLAEIIAVLTAKGNRA